MLNYSKTETIPWFDEFDEMIKTAARGRDVAKDVMVLSLLEFADSGSTEHAEKVLPTYLLDPFLKLANDYNNFWKAGGK